MIDSSDVSFYLHHTETSTPSGSIGDRDGYTWSWWNSKQKWRPPGAGFLQTIAWRYLLYGGNSESRTFQVLYCRYNTVVVNRCYVFSRWYRFPFMGSGDIQIGNLWTDPNHRGRGLATLATQMAAAQFFGKSKIWYLTSPNNAASIKVAENAGFRFIGSGYRSSPLGINILGQFHLLHQTRQT
jgi:RimJ/RimL family protein N-acetyltransferase